MLSRFLMSRMLMMIQIPSKQAVAVALQLKKDLVDQGLLDISQVTLESVLFEALAKAGFEGPEFQRRYRRVQGFLQERSPLLVLVSGPPCSFKSRVAMQLSARLNIANVLQSDLIHHVVRRFAGPAAAADVDVPLMLRPGDLSREGFLAAYGAECRAMRAALEADLAKCRKASEAASFARKALALPATHQTAILPACARRGLQDGKQLLAEGMHLDPAIYVPELEPSMNLVRDMETGTRVAAAAASDDSGPSCSCGHDGRAGVLAPVVLLPAAREAPALLASWYEREVQACGAGRGPPLPPEGVCSLDVFVQRHEWLSQHLKDTCVRLGLPCLEVSMADSGPTVDHIQSLVMNCILSSGPPRENPEGGPPGPAV